MTKRLRMLAGGAVLGALMLGFGGVYRAHEAQAESPPNPPSRFAGTVLVDGAPPPAGTRIEARIGASTCGVTTTFASGGNQNYVLDVPALDPGASPNCGSDGSTVTFFIADKQAAQTGKWANYQLNVLNLSYTSPPSPTPGGPGGVATPRPPVTGNGGVTSGSDNSLELFLALGAAIVVFSAGGYAVSRRSR